MPKTGLIGAERGGSGAVSGVGYSIQWQQAGTGNRSITYPSATLGVSGGEWRIVAGEFKDQELTGDTGVSRYGSSRSLGLPCKTGEIAFADGEAYACVSGDVWITHPSMAVNWKMSSETAPVVTSTTACDGNTANVCADNTGKSYITKVTVNGQPDPPAHPHDQTIANVLLAIMVLMFAVRCYFAARSEQNVLQPVATKYVDSPYASKVFGSRQFPGERVCR